MSASAASLESQDIAPAHRRSGRSWRSRWVRVHRYVGLSIALFLFVAGVTGSLMAFSDEIDAWLNPGLFTVSSRGPALPPARLAAQVETQFPNVRVSFIPVIAAAGESIRINVAPRGADRVSNFNQVFVDPVTGALLGVRDSGAFRIDRAHFIPFITRLHYTLHLPRTVGIWLFGCAAILWLLDCFIGLYLTFPRGRPFMEKWQPAWTIKRKRFSFDLHRASGLWAWLILVPMALSSVYLTLDREVLIPIVNLFSTVTPSPLDARARPQTARAPFDFDHALEIASEAGRAHEIDVPVGALAHRPERGAYFAIYRDSQHPSAGLGNARLYFDDQTGVVFGTRIPGEGTGGDIFMQVQFPLHSGQIIGLPGRIAISLLGICVAALSVTGVLIWLRKRRASFLSEARTRVAHPINSSPPNLLISSPQERHS